MVWALPRDDKPSQQVSDRVCQLPPHLLPCKWLQKVNIWLFLHFHLPNLMQNITRGQG